MELLETNQANIKYPILDSIVKDLCNNAYDNCIDKEYDLTTDIDIRIEEIFINDTNEHKEEMTRIEKLLKEDKSKREIYNLWNLNKKEFLKSKEPILFFPEDVISSVKAINEHKIISKIVNNTNETMFSSKSIDDEPKSKLIDYDNRMSMLYKNYILKTNQ